MAAILQDKLFAGRYTLAELVERDNFFQIWKAEDSVASKAMVLIKIYTPEEGLEIDQIDTAFIPLYSLKHKNLVNALHADVYEGYPYLVMPYFPKGTLHSLLKQEHTFTEEEVASVLHDLAAVLGFLHEQAQPVVYREIKPENVFISNEGKYMLADPRLNSASLHAFPTAYAAPEMFAFRPVKDTASDIFSLGVLLYQLCSGNLPWEGKGGVRLLEGGEIPHLPTFFSRGLNTIIRSCLNPHKTKRPTAKQLKKAAEHYLKKHAWEGEPPVAGKGQAVRKAAPAVTASHPVSRPKLGQKPLAMMLSVLVLLAIGAILYFTVLDFPAKDSRAGADQSIASASEPAEPAPAITETKLPEASSPEAAPEAANNTQEASKVEVTENKSQPAVVEETVEKRNSQTTPVTPAKEEIKPAIKQAPPLALANTRESTPAKTEKKQPVVEQLVVEKSAPMAKNTAVAASGKEPVVATKFMRPSSLSEYLNRLSDTRIPKTEREKWRGDIAKYFSEKEHLIIDGKAGLIAGTYTIDELISFLMRTRDTKVMINQQRTDARGKVSELYVEIIPKNPAQ